MNISQNGIAIIKKFEGCVLKVYLDASGKPTSGYGHTKGITLADVNKPITQAEADANLIEDLQSSENKVMKYYDKYKWNQNEFDSLCSFAFNIGNIDQLTANGTRTRTEIANKMPEYRKAGGKILAGLVKRREAERQLFLKPCSGIKEFSLKDDGNYKVSEHFIVREFRCKDGSDSILVDCDFVKTYLEAIRVHFGKPIVVNSAYRTPTYNQKVGGATNSYHMKGRAFDISITGVTPREVCKYAKQIGIKGVIQYGTFSHVDSRESTYYAVNNGTAVKVTDF